MIKINQFSEIFIMLTRAQHKAFEFIKRYIFTHQFSPTVEEVAKGIGISSKGVAYRYIKALEQVGLIKLVPNRQRNIILSDDSSELTSNNATIPILGKIAAGEPIEAIVNNELINFQTLFNNSKQVYALRVKGDSMIEEGIFNGDIVICEACDVAKDGDIIVALVDNQDATLKRFKKNNDGTITLIPANSTLPPMTLPGNRVNIQGRFIGLLRLKN